MRKVLKPKGFWAQCEINEEFSTIAETIVSLIKKCSQDPYLLIFYVSEKSKNKESVYTFRFNHMASEKVRVQFHIEFSTKEKIMKLVFWEKEQRIFALANITKDQIFHPEYISRLEKFLVAKKSADEMFSEYFTLD